MARFTAFRPGRGLLFPSAHRGLLRDKYFTEGTDEDKLNQLMAFEGVPTDRIYQLAYKRWHEKWKSCGPTSVVLEAKVAGRLAIGLGNENIFDAGLRLHHTYGTPLVPASAIKGVLLRHVKEQKYREFLFGAEGSAGFLEFQDAWWKPVGTGSGFSLDVLTVHHQKYYDGSAAPTDFDSPIPVHFLTFKGTFLFVAAAPSEKWADYLKKLLKEVLGNHGVGGKRSAGYGRFVFD